MKFFAILPLLIPAPHVLADPATVVSAALQPSGDTWRVSVTLSHGDTGWDDYADGWRVLDADGTVIGTRELLHPHVNEQPFTRSLSGVSLPTGVAIVQIESSTNTTGWGGERFTIQVPGR